MRKLNVAIIGQGRSGRNIHGSYYLSENNKYFNLKYVVDKDPVLRADAEKRYPFVTTLSSYKELFKIKDIDLVVNASYSDEHYAITLDLLKHKFNVLSEKPFAANRYECDVLINTAKENGVILAPFQNTQTSPFYLDALQTAKSGILGEIKQVSIRYNSLSRRWDWQTLQKKLGGSAYNTGPHPICMALGFLDFDPQTKVVYSKLGICATSGDAEDYVKIILEAPDHPVVDIEMNSTDPFTDYNLKLVGTRGSMKSTPAKYTKKYYLDSENPPRPVIEKSLRNDEGLPVYCSEKLVTHEESGEYNGNAFNVGTAAIYEGVYYAITKGKELKVSCEQSAMTVGVIETVHAQNPLPVKYL